MSLCSHWPTGLPIPDRYMRMEDMPQEALRFMEMSGEHRKCSRCGGTRHEPRDGYYMLWGPPCSECGGDDIGAEHEVER